METFLHFEGKNGAKGNNITHAIYVIAFVLVKIIYLTNIKHFKNIFPSKCRKVSIFILSVYTNILYIAYRWHTVYGKYGKMFYIFFYNIARRNIKKEIFRVDIELYQHGF
jgi:hypothetical protein